jgi:hypothetical protein
MSVNVGIGQWCGFLFLFVLLTTLLSESQAGATLDREDVTGSLGRVAQSSSRFRACVVLDLVSHVSIVALAATLYLAFHPYNRSLALLGTLWRTAEGTILAFNEVNRMMLLSVAQRFVAATGAESAALKATGRTLMASRDWGYKIGLAFFVLGSLVYAVLFLSSGVVPRAIAWFGVGASLLGAASVWLHLLNPRVSMIGSFALLPYEVVLGVWLLLRGGQIGVP